MRETLCLLRKLLSVHGGLKAVAKVDVQQLAAVSVQHEVAWMPVPQAQQVAHLRMERRGSAPGCAATPGSLPAAERHMPCLQNTAWLLQA